MPTRLWKLSSELDERLDALPHGKAYELALAECRRSIKINDVAQACEDTLERLEASVPLSKALVGKLNRIAMDMDKNAVKLAEELNDEEGSAIRYAKARALASLLRLVAGGMENIKESLYESIMSFDDPEAEMSRITAASAPSSTPA